MTNKAANRAAEQLGECVGFGFDLLFPGVRADFMKRDQERLAAEQQGTIDASTVVSPSDGACESCEGAGELQSVSGRKVKCGACGGKGSVSK